MHLLKKHRSIDGLVQFPAGITSSQAQRNVTGCVARFGACLRYAGALMRDDAKTTPAQRVGALEDRLDSWKEIAAYLGRGIRTVQRWEREEGLPVHRLAHEKRGSIYARREELAAWWESRRLTLAGPSAPEPRRRLLHRVSSA